MFNKSDKIAIMQPYFFPYGGYYRLMAAADVFVIYDCVQFTRRGRVHRCSIPSAQPGAPPGWLTLPITKAPQDIRICDLQFTSDAKDRMARLLGRQRWFEATDSPLRQDVYTLLENPTGTVVDFLQESLRLVRDACGFNCKIMRSTELDLAPDFKGEQRIIEICQRLDAHTYINSPGGVDLYDAAHFSKAGLTLQFLAAYAGLVPNMLQAIFTLEIEQIRDDIRATTTLITG